MPDVSELLQNLNGLTFAGVPTGQLAEYAYALVSLRFPAAVGGGGSCRQPVMALSHSLLRSLQDETEFRLLSDSCNPSLDNAIGIMIYNEPLTVTTTDKRLTCQVIEGSRDLAGLTLGQLVRLHSLSRLWYDARRKKGEDLFTREFQQRIVEAMTSQDPHHPLTHLLRLTEHLEADNYASLPCAACV